MNQIETSPEEQDEYGFDEVKKLFSNLNKNLSSDVKPNQAAAEIEEVEEELPNSDQENQEEEPEEVEVAGEEEGEEVVLEEKKKDINPRLMKRRIYSLIEKLKESEERNNDLSQKLHESLSVHTQHYGASTQMKIEKAEAEQSRALDEGDKEAFFKSQRELFRLNAELSQAEKWSQEDQKRSAKVVSSYQDEVASLKKEMALDWLAQNPEINANSKKYNPELAERFGGFVANLDSSLANGGRADLYMSEEYVNALDNELGRLKVYANRKSPAIVGSVRNSAAPVRNREVKIVLSPLEKRMCENSDGHLTEEALIKAKLQEMKKKR